MSAFVRTRRITTREAMATLSQFQRLTSRSGGGSTGRLTEMNKCLKLGIAEAPHECRIVGRQYGSAPPGCWRWLPTNIRRSLGGAGTSACAKIRR